MTKATFEYTLLGDPVTGVWCPHCARSSAYAVLVMFHTSGRRARSSPGLSILQKCLDCGADSPDGAR